jgi:hypothetical protein
MRNPRLHYRDRALSTFLLHIVATPLFLLLSTFAMFACYGVDHFSKDIGMLAIFLAVLDLISNAYQEVSADKRQEELEAKLAALTHIVELALDDPLTPKG